MRRSTRTSRTRAIRMGVEHAQNDIFLTHEFRHPPTRWEPSSILDKDLPLYRKAYHRTIRNEVVRALVRTAKKAEEAVLRFEKHAPDMSTAWPGDTDNEIRCVCGKATIAEHAHLEEKTDER